MTHTVRLTGEYSRAQARRLIEKAPAGFVMTIAEPKRSNDQNAKMHAMLSDVSRACPEGRRLVPDVWKALFLQALGHDVRFEPALDGRGLVPIGFRSSTLNKQQFSDLIEVIYEYGARHGVRWSEPMEKAA